MKKILFIFITLFFCSGTLWAVEIKPLKKSCDRISSILLTELFHEPSNENVKVLIKVETINRHSFGKTKELHKEFCKFLERKSFRIKKYRVLVFKKGSYKKKEVWTSGCRYLISDIENRSKTIELIVEGDEFVDSFYNLNRNDRMFNHHRYRLEGHLKFFEYIYEKLMTGLEEDYFLYPSK